MMGVGLILSSKSVNPVIVIDLTPWISPASEKYYRAPAPGLPSAESADLIISNSFFYMSQSKRFGGFRLVK